MKIINCPLFEGVSEQSMKNVIKCFGAREVNFNSGAKICSYDSSGRKIGVVLSGKAYVKKLDVNGNYTILEILARGSVFGEPLAYAITELDSVDVLAQEDCVVLFFDYTNILKRCENACEYHSKIVENFLNILIDRANVLSKRIEILSNKTIREKILSYCYLQVSKNGGDNFVMPMTYTSFAEYVCVDRSAMMRELKKLNDDGILTVNKKNITINKRI